MMSIVRCKQCLKELSLLNNTVISVNYSTSEFGCDKCKNIITRNHTDSLCSEKCFIEYIKNYLNKHKT